MSIGYAPRKFEFVKNLNGTPQCLEEPRAVLASTESFTGSARSGRIMPGCLVCKDASVASMDRATSAETTNSGGDTPPGSATKFRIVAMVLDSKGRPKDNQLLDTDEAGYVVCYDPAGTPVFRLVEDATGGAMATTTATVNYVLGTDTSYTSDETVAPNPDPNDKLDSSGADGNSGQNCFAVVGLDPDPRNDATAKVYQVYIRSTWSA